MTTTPKHKHKARESFIVGWTRCVAVPSQCCNGMAHGGVTTVETCSCGARRFTESNGKRSLTSPWQKP